MGKKINVSRNVDLDFGSRSSAIKYLGRTYQGDADAAKEPTSNALDEHINPDNAQRAKEIGICKVIYRIEKKQITIDLPYGMSEERFEEVVQNIAKSIKQGADFTQIGHQAIGLFSWLQFANQCVYYSKVAKGEPTFKVIVKEGVEHARFEPARSHESLKEPGMRFVITDLHSNPLRARSPLSLANFSKFLGNKYRHFLRENILEIELHCKGECCEVVPMEINLPRIAEDYSVLFVKGDESKRIELELYFDSSGKGIVGIRHQKVPNVDDIRELDAMGFEESVFASGNVSGFMDANFITPVTGKTGFIQDKSWYDFIVSMNDICPSVEAEVEALKEAESAEKLTKIRKQAIDLAKEILNDPYFSDVPLIEGLHEPTSEIEPKDIVFDFVPSTLRVDPGKKKSIVLKTHVPGFIPDKGIITFAIDNPDIEISPKRVTVRNSDADSEGIVSIKVLVSCDEEVCEPAVLIAKHKDYNAEANVRFVEQEVFRGPRKPREKPSLNYREVAFKDEGPLRHSRFVGKVIEINTLNPDYLKAIAGSDRDLVEYAALLIAKENLAHNDLSGVAGESLEKFLTFHFRLGSKITRKKK